MLILLLNFSDRFLFLRTAFLSKGHWPKCVSKGTLVALWGTKTPSGRLVLWPLRAKVYKSPLWPRGPKGDGASLPFKKAQSVASLFGSVFRHFSNKGFFVPLSRFFKVPRRPKRNPKFVLFFTLREKTLKSFTRTVEGQVKRIRKQVEGKKERQ